jgi:hypothetical protein
MFRVVPPFAFAAPVIMPSLGIMISVDVIVVVVILIRVNVYSVVVPVKASPGVAPRSA